MSLKEYRRKRDFSITPEPGEPGASPGGARRRFVIQKHDASRLHFDLRLELGRTLVSWAVPKGLPLKHGEKRLAVKVEDHPLSYYDFEGTIPKGEYGGGTVQVWDLGTFDLTNRHPLKDLKAGKLHFVLHGKKLSGEWYLVRLREENQWLVIRGGPDHPPMSRRESDRSALSDRTMSEIGRGEEPPLTSLTLLTPEEVSLIDPMKARLVGEPPPGEWGYEVKFDGYRAIAYKEGAKVGVFSRTRNDLAGKFPEVASAIAGLEVEEAVFDGEVVALDAKGRSSFQLLQRLELGESRPPLAYYVFDLLKWNGKSLLSWPLEKRKEALRSLIPPGDAVIRFSALLEAEAELLLSKATELGLEGVIGKRSGSRYEPGRRSGAWIKLKLLEEQEFVIGGYTEPEGSRTDFGAILVGYFDRGELQYAGKVGTGFSEAALKKLHALFRERSREETPFANLPEKRRGRYGQGITAAVMRRCHWVEPTLVAAVRFSQWTEDGRLRQPVYLGLRTDKPAGEVIREVPT